MDVCFKGVSVLFIYLDHLSHVALGARVFGGIFNFYQHNKEQVVPHVVLLFDVLLKSHRLVVKLVPLQAYGGAITRIIYGTKLDSMFKKKQKLASILPVSVSQCHWGGEHATL